MIKKLLPFLFLFSAFFSNAQRTMFSRQNNYVAPVIPSVPTIVTNGLVFNVDAANTSSYTGSSSVWNDLSGTNHINFYSNSSYNTNATPTFSSDGGGSLITTGIFGKSVSNSGISGSVARSMEAWVKFNSVAGNAVISIGGSVVLNNTLYELMAFNSNVIEHYWGNFTQSSTVLATNTWYHIVIMYDGTTNHYVYVNGVQVGFSSTPTLNTSNTPIYIGPAVTTSWGAFDGKIAALRIYNRALSSTDITNNFNVLKSRFGL
ncbi:MAG: Aureococcus anophagefferens virus [Bacteroidota bacterium]